jgi:uncharacterized membrane protein (UPF0127 family)
MRSAAGVLLFAALAACEKAPHVTPDAAPESVQQAAAPPPHDPPTIDALRAAHDVGDSEGATCTTDRACAPPLRCLDAQCAFPPAMTGRGADAAPRVTFAGERLAEATYYLEVADDPDEQSRGLMFRRSMVGDAGMIFMFDRDAPRSFWMRNTLISLDMIFVTSEGIVDSAIEGASPQTDTPRPSVGPARYVIELNAGEVARMGLRAGSRVRFAGLAGAP